MPKVLGPLEEVYETAVAGLWPSLGEPRIRAATRPRSDRRSLPRWNGSMTTTTTLLLLLLLHHHHHYH